MPEFTFEDAVAPANEFSFEDAVRSPIPQYDKTTPAATTAGEFMKEIGAGSPMELMQGMVKLPLDILGRGASKAYNAPIDALDFALRAIGRTGIPENVTRAKIANGELTAETVPGGSLPFDIANPSTWRATPGRTWPFLRAIQQLAGKTETGLPREPLPSPTAELVKGFGEGLATPEGTAGALLAPTQVGMAAFVPMAAEQIVTGLEGLNRRDASFDERIADLLKTAMGTAIAYHANAPEAPPAAVRPELSNVNARYARYSGEAEPAGLLPEFAGPSVPTEPRFRVDPTGRTVDMSQYSPKEQREIDRMQLRYTPRGQYVQETPGAGDPGAQPIEGGMQYGAPLVTSPGQPFWGELQKAYQAAGEAKQGGQISFEGTAEGGVPNALQQKIARGEKVDLSDELADRLQREQEGRSKLYSNPILDPDFWKQQYDRYQELVAAIKAAPFADKFKMSAEIEKIKNIYGGFPPPDPSKGEPNASAIRSDKTEVPGQGLPIGTGTGARGGDIQLNAPKGVGAYGTELRGEGAKKISEEDVTRTPKGSAYFQQLDPNNLPKQGSYPVLIDSEGRWYTSNGAVAHWEVFDDSPVGKNDFVEAGFINNGKYTKGSDYFPQGGMNVGTPSGWRGAPVSDLYGTALDEHRHWITASQDRLALENLKAVWEKEPTGDRKNTTLDIIDRQLAAIEARQGKTSKPWPPPPKYPDWVPPEPGKGKKFSTEQPDDLGKVKDVLARIATNRSSKYSDIAEHLLQIGDKEGLEVPVGVEKGMSPFTAGYYSPANDHIRLNPGYKADDWTIIHEIVHALTNKKLASDITGSYKAGAIHRDALNRYLKDGTDENVKELIKLYQDAQKELPPDVQSMYGMTDFQEFMAEGFSNPKFQEHLSLLRPGGLRNLWERFKKAVTKLLGFSLKDEAMLSGVIEHTAQLMSKDRPKTTALEKPAPDVQQRLYTNPFFDPEIYKGAGAAIKKGVTKSGETFKAELKNQLTKMFEPGAVNELLIDVRTPLPDFTEIKKATEIFSRPSTLDRVPVVGRLMGGLSRVKGAVDESIARWAAEKYGVGPAISSALAEQIRGKVNNAFEIDAAGDMNVKALIPGSSLKASDVFETLQKNPSAYKLTDHQRQVWEKTIQPILQRMNFLKDKYKVANVIDEHGDFTSYFPRIVVKIPEKIKTALRSSRAGQKQFFQFERPYPTEQAGWTDGIKYSRDIEQRLVMGTERMYRAIADKRLSTDPNLAGFNRRTLLADMRKLYAVELASGTMTEAEVRNMAKVTNFGTVHSPAFAGRVFPPEVADRLNSELINDQSRLRKTIADFNSISKALTLGMDIGVGQIQLLPLITRRPDIWTRAVYTSLKAVVSPQVFANYVRQNIQPVRELAQLGSSVGKLQDFMQGFSHNTYLSKVPIVGPLGEAFGRQYQSALDVAKVELWKAFRDVTPKTEWVQRVKSIENSLGMSRMESAMVHPTRALGERTFFLASSYYRGAIGYVADALGKGVTAKEARKGLAAYMLGGVALFYGIAKGLNMDDEEIKRRLDPSQSDFLLWRVKVGDHYLNVGPGGIYRSLLRLAGNIGTTAKTEPANLYRYWSSERNPLARWYRGHSGPLPSKLWDIVTGKDYMGKAAGIESFGKAGVPLIAQDIARGPSEYPKSGLEYVSDALGGMSFPDMRTSTRQLDAQSKLYPGQQNLSMYSRYKVAQEMDKTKPQLERTRQDTITAANRAMEADQRRGAELQSSLAPNHQQWLEENKVRIAGYDDALTMGGKKILLSQEEKDYFKESLRKNYETQLGSLEKGNWFKALDTDSKKKVLEQITKTVNRAARADTMMMIEEKSHPRK